MSVKKNIFILILGILFTFNFIFNYKLAYSASSDLTIDTYKINNADSGPYTFNPGEEFEFDIWGINNTGNPLKNVFVNIDFSNNGNFDYNGSNHRTRINATEIANPVPDSAYTSGNGLHFEITNSSNDTVNDGEYPQLNDLSNQEGFFAKSSISDYQQDVTVFFTGDDSGTIINGESKTKTLYINIKPHITDYYFSKNGSKVSSITNDGSDSVNLVVKIKDYNGYQNIDGGSITADLSSLGLGTSESLSYSGNIDSNTAEFRKNNITTTVSSGDYYFGTGEFEAIDENNNTDEWDDPYFSGDDKSTEEKLTVESPGAPSVTITSLSDDYIGGPNEQSSVVKFTGDQNGSGKIVTNGNSDCSSGNVVKDWFNYSQGNTASGTVYTGNLNEGSNTIDICLKNSNGKIGASNISIEKDTSSPSVNNFSLSPASVTTENSSVSFECGEDGSYKACVNSGSLCSTTLTGWTSISKNTTVDVSIPNSDLVTGDNEIQGFCKDKASNQGIYTGTVTKEEPVPSMSGYVNTLSDNDIDYEGLDGRDITVSWNNDPGLNYSGFESWRIYVLPSSTSLNISNHNYIKLIADESISKWTGSDSITKDSAGNNFVSGSDYNAYVAIIGSNGNLGEFGETNTATLYGDEVNNADVESSSFVSDTGLKLNTTATLDTDLSSHSGKLISYDYESTTYTGKSIISVDGKSITVEIPSLNNDLSATGTNLEVLTGALHSDAGGYNNYIYSGGILIGDKQNPGINNYSLDSSSIFSNNGNNFYKGIIDFSWIFGEDMGGGGVTKFEFDRQSGNTSNNDEANLTSSSELSSGSHSKSINLSGSNSDEVVLNCGTEYGVRIYGEDKAGNSNTTSYINNIWYDSCPPNKVSLNKLDTVGTGNVDLTWNIPDDDNGNGSGISGYDLKFYNNSGCSTLSGSYNLVSTGKSFSLANGDYSWKVRAIDNMNNTGNYSSCDDFTIDDTVPTISNAFIKDTTLNSKNYSTTGNNVDINADITNTDSGHIWLKMSSLAGATYDNVQCSNTNDSNISCSYSDGTVTYNFPIGFSGSVNEGTNQVKFTVQNNNGANEETKIISTTVDKFSPTVVSDTITQPNGGEIWGGTKDIKWDTSKISDSIGLDYIKLEYSTGAGLWNFIHSGSNSSPYSWDLSSLNGGTGYRVRITAYDNVSLSGSDISDNTFSIDGQKPSISLGIINSPASGDLLKGGSTVNIQWNSGYISDDITPITGFSLDFYYSTDDGASWSLISSGESNNGSYNWTIPTVDTNQGKLKMIAHDEAGNSIGYIPNYNFSIDSSKPSLNITYATEGGKTPPNGSKINNKRFDVSISVSDANLSGVYYKLKNSTDIDFWNVSLNSWTGNNWNLVCGGGCNNSYTGINAVIENNNDYILSFKAIDKAGNEKYSTDVGYKGDTTKPQITSLTNSGAYFSGVVNINGTGFDNYEIGSVTLQILKGTDYWNGSSFQSGQYTLGASGTTDWSYSFNMPDSDSENQKYKVNYFIEDTSYKVSNSNSGSINIYKDTQGPEITTGGTFWTAPTGGTVINGGTTFDIQWNSGNISDSLAGLANKPIKIEYYNGSSRSILSGATENDGLFSWNVPSDETTSAQIRITANDNIGNKNNTTSDFFIVDSNPPSLTGLQTMDKDADGQIDALSLEFSENIDDDSVSIGDFSISNGISISSFDTAGSVDDKYIELTFANTGDTSTTPSLSYTKGSLEDLAGNKLGDFSTGATDDALPRIENTKVFDDNIDGKLDKIEVVFSENMQSVSDSSVFSLDNALGGLTINSVSRDNNDNSIINLSITGQNNINTSTGGMKLDFDGNSSDYLDLADNKAAQKNGNILIDKAKPIITNATINDIDSNYEADNIQLNFSENLSGNVNGFSISSGNLSNSGLTDNTVNFDVSGISGTAPSETISYTSGSLEDKSGNLLGDILDYNLQETINPELLTINTNDEDNNGKVDSVILKYSESLTGDFTSANFSVDGYNIENKEIINNSDIKISLQENDFDSDNKPYVSLSSNTSLKDKNNNKVENFTDNQSNDKVGPVIIGARYDGNSGKLNATFSENYSGSLNTGDFVLSGTDMSIDSINSTGSYKVELQLTGGTINYGISKISFDTNAVEDKSGNSQDNKYFAVISAPIFINEVMISGTGNYIELRNSSSSNISLSGWSIAGVNIPDLTITGDSYFLISDETKTNSIIDVNTDFISGGLSSLSSGSTINLNNGTIDIDKATIFSSLIDTKTPKSIERRENPGDGTVLSNWYTAQDKVGFENETPYGTPGTGNVYDATSPTIDSTNIADDQLFPDGNIEFVFNYSDNLLGIDKETDSANLEKYDNGSWSGLSLLNSKTITAEKAIYELSSPLDYGKYKISFDIKDKAGNVSSTKEIIFYVDNLQVDIDKNNIDIGTLRDGVKTFSTNSVTITVKTVGAGFDIQLDKDGNLKYGGTEIDNSEWGYDIDNGGGYSDTITSVDANTIISQSKNIDTDGNLNIHTYDIKYGAQINTTQPAGQYTSSTLYDFAVSY